MRRGFDRVAALSPADAPYLWQRGIAREDERAMVAAHLHDSVLQTLALIQRQSHDSAAVSVRRPAKTQTAISPIEEPTRRALSADEVAEVARDVHRLVDAPRGRTKQE